MGIFSFLKKNKEPKEKERISQNQLSDWLENKKKEHNDNEREFLAPIKERISQLISELKLETSVLENVDVESKKVDSRIKLIVKENLRNYIGYLHKMTERLEEIDKREKLVDRINFIFEDFNKKSMMSYEKITFIVGKEMQATKDSVKKFLKDLEIILKSNKKVFEEFETIELVEIEIKKLNEIKDNKSKVLEVLNEDISKLNNLAQELKNREKELEELKKSERFIQEIKKEQKLELEKKELEKNIDKLNRAIDFKALSNFYHKFENEMKIAKQYRENFKQSLKKLGIENLSKLLLEAKQENKEILELIQKIRDKEKIISETIIEDFGKQDLEREINKIKSEAQDFTSAKSIKEKKLKNLDQDLNKMLDGLKEKLEKINVEFD